MKKALIYSMILATAVFSSCKGDYDDWANPQANAQEEAKNVAFSVTPSAAINLTTLEETEAKTVQLFTPAIQATDNLTPVSYEVQLSKIVDDGADAVTDTLKADLQGNVKTARLKEIVNNFYGKYPTERTVTTLVKAILKNGSNEAYYKEAAEVTNQITPVNFGTAYKLVVNDGEAEYDLATDEASYPNFSLSFKAVADNSWTIVTADGDPVAEGTVAKTGAYNVSYNAESGFANVEKAPSVLYMKGDANGWNDFDYLAGTDEDGTKFTGYMYLTQGGFKFTTAQDWSGTNYGENFSTDGGAGNIVMTEPDGYYKVDVDLSAKTYTLTPITVGIVGSGVGDWNVDTEMTYNKATRAWEVSNVELADGEIKFRANHEWAINWGGDVNALTQGGANIAVTAGTYDIKIWAWVDGHAKCEITKK